MMTILIMIMGVIMMTIDNIGKQEPAGLRLPRILAETSSQRAKGKGKWRRLTDNWLIDSIYRLVEFIDWLIYLIYWLISWISWLINLISLDWLVGFLDWLIQELRKTAMITGLGLPKKPHMSGPLAWIRLPAPAKEGTRNPKSYSRIRDWYNSF